MHEIPLTQGLFALVDDADFERVSQHRWHAVRHKHTFYASAIANNRSIYLHRFICDDIEKPFVVDHKNRNGLDNRRCNLRKATQSQNMANSPRAFGKYGYRGISSDKARGRYKAICGDRLCGTISRGKWRNTVEEAAHDYDSLAVSKYGEFAILNFPDRESGGLSA
jgi:hypothetical protein